MPNQYYVMRHGESSSNRQGIIVSKPCNARHYFGLTNKGAEQVMQSATYTRLGPDTIVISSDYRRAVETAEILHDIICLNTPLIFDARLRERDFGTWELTHHDNYRHVWQSDEQFPNQRVNRVESVSSVLSRVLTLVNELDNTYQNSKVLLVGHGDVLQILLAASQGLEPKFHRSLAPLRNAEIRSLPAIAKALTA